MIKNKSTKIGIVTICLSLVCILGFNAGEGAQGVKASKIVVMADAAEKKANKKPQPTLPADFTYDSMETVKIGGCKYAYSAVDEYYQSEVVEGGHNFALYEFKQKYDKKGNPVYTDIVIPDKIGGIPVVAVSYDVFKHHDEIRSIILGKNVVQIGKEAFEGCKGIKKVVFSKALKRIGYRAFFNCKKLKRITIPKKVETIDYLAFGDCINLEEVSFKGVPQKLTNNAISNTKWLKKCKRKGIAAISNGILIDASGLSGQVKITGKKVKRIIPYAFEGANKITHLEIDSVKEISGNFLACNNSIKTLKVTNVEDLPVYCFAQALSLKKVVISSDISEIPKCSFNNCKKLETLEIHSTKKLKWATKQEESIIGTYVFGNEVGTKNIKDIYLHSTEVDESITEAGMPDTVTLHVPAEAVEEYQKYVKCKVVAL